MRKYSFIILPLLLAMFFLPMVVPSVFPGSSLFPSDELRIVESYQGSMEEVIAKLEAKFGPFEEELRLENATWLKAKPFSIQILEDNYLQGDYVALISF